MFEKLKTRQKFAGIFDCPTAKVRCPQGERGIPSRFVRGTGGHRHPTAVTLLFIAAGKPDR